jgi:RNA polymerase sigma-70 factor (ECF subfamily)
MRQDLQPKFGASDIVQSACHDIYEHFHEFRGETVAEWATWLRQLVVRDVRDVTRRFRQGGKRDVQRERQLVDDAGFQFDTADGDLTPRAALIAKEDVAVLRAALQRLSEEHRSAIRLRNWDELSFAEIGRRLNRSEQAARKLWMRAVEKLQAELTRIAKESE